jgi:hypothetical protein
MTMASGIKVDHLVYCNSILQKSQEILKHKSITRS